MQRNGRPPNPADQPQSFSPSHIPQWPPPPRIILLRIPLSKPAGARRRRSTLLAPLDRHPWHPWTWAIPLLVVFMIAGWALAHFIVGPWIFGGAR